MRLTDAWPMTTAKLTRSRRRRRYRLRQVSDASLTPTYTWPLRTIPGAKLGILAQIEKKIELNNDASQIQYPYSALVSTRPLLRRRREEACGSTDTEKVTPLISFGQKILVQLTAVVRKRWLRR
ncbi:hypothetical protein EVAR_56938_1 [Eumeta japonica]|uniref:Uncharacterized protein n=1 Tax=Eumeta variegata TaxID=151549 RepID=A0A4C1YFM6_EUMVA|nr:hypothetical protein EVAR_56938_1 [Eumeta japonica]